MATQKVRSELHPPDDGRWGWQPRSKGRRVAALVVAASIAAGGVALALTRGDSAPGPADQGTANASADAGPTVAPEGDFAIYDIASGEVTPGPELGTSVEWLSPSPDGTMITYTSWVEGQPLVHVANVDGSDARAYEGTRAPSGVVAPSWSPDGSTIVYQTMGREGNRTEHLGDLFLLDVASGDVRQLADLGGMPAYFWYMAPTFDPSGDAVLYMVSVSPTRPRWALWSIPVTGGKSTLIRRGVGRPISSPPSTGKIAFVEMRLVDDELTFGDLWMSDPDGSDAERLLRGWVENGGWSPDGTQIYFVDKRGTAMVLDVATGETTEPPVANMGGWLDAGTLLIGT